MKFLDVALAILVAFLVQTVLGRYFAFLNVYLDLFTVVAVTFGFRTHSPEACSGSTEFRRPPWVILPVSRATT